MLGNGQSGESSDRNTLDMAEIDPEGRSAYEVVDQHRPHWMRTRGQTSVESPQPVKVYLGVVEYGPPNTLREFSATEVDSIQYYDELSAQARFGMDNINGVIQLHLRND